MTTETKLPFDNRTSALIQSKLMNQLDVRFSRSMHFEKVEKLPMPKPDKTKIDNWNFTNLSTYGRK